MNTIVRKVDKLGRIVLPMNYRKALGLNPDSEVVLGIDGGIITVKPYGERCKLCGSQDMVNEQLCLCSKCISRVKNI